MTTINQLFERCHSVRYAGILILMPYKRGKRFHLWLTPGEGLDPSNSNSLYHLKISDTMKKIIIAFDGASYSPGAFELAMRLNELEPILLTGVFLPQLDLPDLAAFSYANMGAGYMPMMEEYSREVVEKTVEQFEHDCVRNGVEYRVHREMLGFSMAELQKETRYADLLILGNEVFYASLGTDKPNDYLLETLHQSECPVLITPEKFRFPDSLVLAYDGSEDSVYAIKQFAALFPALCTLKTVLVYGTDSKHPQLPDADYIKELAARHFPDLTMEVMEAAPARYFGTWIRDINDPLLICGAYGRSRLSLYFSKSFISDVIRDHTLPIFITHR